VSFLHGTIEVGHRVRYHAVYSRNGFGVYEYEPENRDHFFGIARELSSPSFWPASVIATFDSEAQAIETLNRWANALVIPRLPRKPRRPGALRRNSNRPRQRREGPGQMMLDL
jgi:hypothetical protein